MQELMRAILLVMLHYYCRNLCSCAKSVTCTPYCFRGTV